MIFAKAKLITAGAALLTVFALLAVVGVQAARIDTVRAERNVAVQMYEDTTAQLQAAMAYRQRLAEAVTQRERELKTARAQLARVQGELRTLSAGVDDEKWQECRTVVVPDALIDKLRTTHPDGG